MNKIYRFPSGLRLAYKYSPAVRSVGIAVMTVINEITLDYLLKYDSLIISQKSIKLFLEK